MKKAFALLALLAYTPALAGGMVLPFRGVRDAARGGAFVAGAEDADAIWLDPAGIAKIDHMTLTIATMYVDQQVDYTRIDSGGNTMSSVANDHPGQPIPTIAFVAPIGDGRLVVGGGTWTPYAGLHRYAIDGAQRYGSISIAETKILYLTAAAGYRVTDKLRVGATIQNMVTMLDSRLVLSGCPGQTVCAPEDPEFDSDVRVRQTDMFSPSGSVGVQFDAHPQITVGAMFQLPAKISGAEGELQAKLPSSGFYEGAMLVGDTASVEMTLPASVHVGVEYHRQALRLEAALHVELWSMHDAITFTPKDMRIENVAGVGTYELGPSVIPRNYKNSYAPAIGGEYAIRPDIVVGAGYSYETSAAPKGYVSPLTVDAGKHLFGLGGSFHAKTWSAGATVAFAKLADTDVALADAKVPQLTPVRGQPTETMINAGHYESAYVLAGVTFTKAF
jgi:long-chain fatty acid transport protein